MEIGSAFSTGLQGYQRAEQAITQESANIAQQGAQSRSLAEDTAAPPPEPQQAVQQQQQSLESSVVNLTSELNNAQANVRSIETADEVLGSIIDLRV